MLEKSLHYLDFVSTNAKLQTQRPTKVSIHYKEKLRILLDELELRNII